MATSHSVMGLYNDKQTAGRVVDELYRHGYGSKDISLLMSEGTFDREFSIKKKTKASEGLAAGATIGGTLGAIAAGLTAVGAITLTGGAGIVAVGPLVAALAGGGAGAAAGGTIGGLLGLGFNEHEAKLVDNHLEGGRVLLAVEVPPGRETDPVKKVLTDYGATEVTVH